MSKTDGSEHAFPHIHISDCVIKLEGGLTKREYFSAMAMQGLLANDKAVEDAIHTTKQFQDEEVGVDHVIAVTACKHADALINALNKETV